MFLNFHVVFLSQISNTSLVYVYLIFNVIIWCQHCVSPVSKEMLLWGQDPIMTTSLKKFLRKGQSRWSLRGSFS